MSAPAYDSAAANADLDDVMKNITPAEKAAAQAAMSKEMGKEATVKSLMDEVKALGASTRQMDADINKIYNTFGEIDNAGFNFPRKLQPEWKVLKDRWTKLLWDSRDAASRTAGNLKTCTKVVLPTVQGLLNDPLGDPVENAARARNILQNYANGNSPVAEISTDPKGNYAASFLQLKDDMERFKNSFNDFTKAERAKIEAQISSVKSQISSITSQIQNAEAAAARLGRCLGFTIFGTAVVAGISLFAFGLLGPLIAVKVLIVGALIAIAKKQQMIGYINQANALRGQLAAKQAELNNLQNKLKLLEKCEAQLEANRTCIGSVAERIGGIAAIWSTMRSNALEVDQMIADTNDQTDPMIIDSMLTLLKDTYTPLCAALQEYATQISSSGAGR